MWEVTVVNLDIDLNKTFSYLSENFVEKYTRVRVQFNHKEIIALAIACNKHHISKFKLKKIIEVIDSKSLLTANQVLLLNYISKLNDQRYSKIYNLFLSHYFSTSVLRDDKLINKLDKFIQSQSQKTVATNHHLTKLNSEQLMAVNRIESSENKFSLVHGVTSSGKSEIIIHLINNLFIKQKDSQVLLMVPEIFLTLQFREKLKKYFKNLVFEYSSSTTMLQRYKVSEYLKTGKAAIIISTRKGVFLPFTNLQHIFIDEEHDSSYIQDTIPSYNAKSLAVIMAEKLNIKLSLFSATPSLTSFVKARHLHKMEYIRIDKSYNQSKVDIEVIDMKKEPHSLIISPLLLSNIEKNYLKGQKTILILNRRALASTVQCGNCFRVKLCINCDVSLKLHNDKSLKCHYCNYYTKNLNCDYCGSDKLDFLNYGLQKLEKILKENQILSQAKIMRVDSDSVLDKKNTFEAINIKHDFDILIGSQIISKGIDFKAISLLAIIDADYLLSRSSFSSGEECYNFLVQAIGRAGRDMDTKIVIQAFNPDHFVIQAVINKDFDSFIDQELYFRRHGNYPPYMIMSQIRFYSHNYNDIINQIKLLRSNLRFKSVDVIGPSNIIKINNTYQFQLIIRASNNQNIGEYLQFLLKNDIIKLDYNINNNIDRIS